MKDLVAGISSVCFLIQVYFYSWIVVSHCIAFVGILPLFNQMHLVFCPVDSSADFNFDSFLTIWRWYGIDLVVLLVDVIS
jgi:hypothetical protein